MREHRTVELAGRPSCKFQKPVCSAACFCPSQDREEYPMKSTFFLGCLALGAQLASAQYKAILSTPTPPIHPPALDGDVKAGVELRAVSGGYAWGQYQGRAVKISLA